MRSAEETVTSTQRVPFENWPLVTNIRTCEDFEGVFKALADTSDDVLASNCPVTGQSVLFYAVQRKNDEEALKICTMLCDERKVCSPAWLDANQQSALFFAARDGNVKCVRYLLEKGCNPNHRDSAEQTALFYAAREGRTDVVEALLDAGADINAMDHLGQTALFYASRDGRFETVKAMVSRGADVAVRDKYKRTAGWFAHQRNHQALFEFLKDRGGYGELDAVADAGGTPGINRSLKRGRSDNSNVCQRKCYRLVVKGPYDTYYSAPNGIIALFEQRFPNIAVWDKSSPSPVETVANDLIPKWQSIASRMLEELSAVEGGWIFTKPVDCKAWGCPDYFDVIKNPMDYSKIKKKFKTRQYTRCSQFMDDMNLVFSNCFKYNKPESAVAGVARTVQSAFNAAVATNGLQEILDKEQELLEEWYPKLYKQLEDELKESQVNQS